MNNYIPFLKLKGSEISALKALKGSHPQIQPIPFFDFPRKKPKKTRKEQLTKPKTKSELFLDDLLRLRRKYELNLKHINSFYLDNYDIEDTVDYKGAYNYVGIIETFGPLGMIPVIGLDRSFEHLKSIKDGLDKKIISSERIAIRLTQEDFESYGFIRNDLISLINDIYFDFDFIDIVLDCRVCILQSAVVISPLLIDFLKCLSKEVFRFSRVVISGSSVPASISDVVLPRSEKDIVREEIIIYENILSVNNDRFHYNIFFGDYTCVSPDYSDVELFDEDMDNITTAKLIYPYDNNLLLLRGGKFKVDRNQFCSLAKKLIAKPNVYRGERYSPGDKYVYEKAHNVGKNATASSIVPHLVNLHLVYVFNK